MDLIAWQRRARHLAYFTIAYNLLEAAVAITFGWRDGSLALGGFGVDSLLESASAGVVLWRLNVGDGEEAELRETKARKAIGGLLLTLAAGLSLGALLQAWRGAGPSDTWMGVAVSVVSLLVMGFLYKAKRAAADALGSAALREDAFCTLSCMWLSGALLAGSLAFEGFGLQLFDAVATLGMAVLIAREGREAWEGEACHDGCEAHGS